MSKNNPDKAIYPTTAIKTTDGKSKIAVDFIREFYINSDKSLEELSIQLSLPLAEVEYESRQGMKSWYQMKQDHLAARMKYFMDVNIDNLMETHSILEDGHFLMIAQIKGTQDFLKSYLLDKGHLFRVGEDGEISVDNYGLPIPLPLPNGQKHFMALESFLKLKETTKQAMNQVYNAEKEKRDIKTVDVDSYDLFESEKKAE